MKKLNNKVFLYSGLALLAIAFIIRYLGVGVSFYLFWILFGIAILLKALFLVGTFSKKGLKAGKWLCFILAGVILIFVSMVFKYLYPVPLLRDILFYGAITLKVIGLILMLTGKNNLTGSGS